MPKQNVPALRLEGFSGEWEETTLGELGIFRSGTGFPEREQGGTIGLPFYKVSDLSAPGNELQLQSANHYVTEGQIVHNHWAPVTAVPAILFAKVGAAVFLGRKRLVNNAFLLDNNLMAFSLNTESWDVQFADTYLKTVDLTQFTQSGALPSLNARHLAEAEAIIPPTLEEQQAIGAIFTNLDAAINQHTLKHKALQQSKTALMQRMFPQEGQTVPALRLEGFDGEWEEKRLVDEVSFFSGLTYTPSDVVEHGGTLVLRSSNVQDGVIATKDCVYVRTDAVNVQNVRENDIVMVVRNGSRSLIGKHTVVQTPMPATVIGAFMTGIRTNQPWFYNALFSTDLFKYEVDKSMGATINQITGGMFTGMSFYIPPTLEEQQAIGAVFTNLDQLIAAEAHYIASLKQAKTALLQRMFI